MELSAVRKAKDLHRVAIVEADDRWGIDVMWGRLVELSGGRAGAVLTAAVRVVLEAQRRGEPAAWVTPRDRSFYPPDVAAAGGDLASLPVIRVARASELSRVADPLLRSGGFGLVVMDFGAGAFVPIPVQTRLAGLAKKHGAAVLCLTEKSASEPSIGSLVSLRAEACRFRPASRMLAAGAGAEAMDAGRVSCRVRVLKDKRGQFSLRRSVDESSVEEVEVFRAPHGLC